MKDFSKSSRCSKCGSYKIKKQYILPRENEMIDLNGKVIPVSELGEFLLCKCDKCGYKWLSDVYESD